MSFENLVKMRFLKIALKISVSFEKIEMFDVFLRWLDEFVIKPFTQKNHLSSKMLFFAFLPKKTKKYKKTFPKHH